MRELAYKPNNLARSLQGKSAQLIGLIFPNISNVFYAELIDKLEHELFKQGYKTIICNSEHDSDKEREYLEMLEANQVDGIGEVIALFFAVVVAYPVGAAFGRVVVGDVRGVDVVQPQLFVPVGHFALPR